MTQAGVARPSPTVRSETPLLEVDNISLRFGGIRALDGVSFRVEEGAIVGLIGPNGAGKTTAFNCITRIYDPDAGRIRLAGTDLLHVGPHDVIRRGVARTFQNVELFKTQSTLDNVLVGLHTQLHSRVWDAAVWLGRTRAEERRARERVDEVLEFLGLTAYRGAIVASLPFGVQKSVELARALVSRPRLLLLDEPAAGQNPTETGDLADRICRIQEAFGVTVLLVEHDMSLVMSICHQVYVLDFGQLIAAGPPSDVQADPRVVEAYLGQAQPD